jgi:uncharacterized membrane protein YqjE
MSDTGATSVNPTSSTASTAPAPTSGPAVGEPSTGELISRLTQQSSELIRSELQLAKTEMTEKAKHAGVGVGMFGGAGIVALYGLGTLIAAIVLALALLLPAWLSALIVAVVLFAIAGVVALMGKKQVAQATPAKPERTVENVQRDVETVKGGGTHERH